MNDYAFTADVLTMTVLIGEHGYPSLNRIGADSRRNGRKSKAYHALHDDIVRIGEYAVQCGWKMVEYPCDVSITLYAVTKAPRDGLNIGHVEGNSLTHARVWADDRLAPHPRPGWVYDPAGPERVVITITKLPQVGAQKAAKPRPVQENPRKYKKVQTDDGRHATLGGQPITVDAAMKLVRSRRAR